MPIDLFACAGHANPFVAYAEARRLEPVSELPALGVWSVTRYADCVHVLRNPTLFSADRARYGGTQPAPLRDGALAANMLASDPPAHGRLRGVVARAFTAPAIARWEPRIQHIADALLDRAAASGRMDVIGDLAHPLPLLVIAELLGIQPQPLHELRRASDALVSARQVEDVSRARGTLEQFFERTLADARQHGGRGIIGDLLRRSARDGAPTPEELAALCMLLIVAGNETTRNLIGNAVLALLQHPAALRRLCSEPALLPTAIEEVARYYPPVQCAVRYTTGAAELGGRTIRPRRPVFVWLAAGNRDDAAFADAETFDIARRPNRHLSFGHGVHTCLGAFLGRLEAAVALRTMLRRLERLRFADDQPFDMLESFMAYGVRHLHLRFDARVPSAPASGDARPYPLEAWGL